jgi:NitT/TauT family transport system substrate-binding protein
LYTSDVLVFAGPLLAQFFGEFEKENLDVQMEIVPPADGTVLLAQGEADIVMTGVNPGHLSLMNEGAPVKYVVGTLGEELPETESVYMRKEFLDAAGNPDLDKVRGSTFMVSIGGGGGFGASGALPTYRWLKANGLGPDDITAANAPSMGDASLGLINGQFAASLILTPAITAVEESGCCVRLPDTIAADGVFLANTDWMADEPEVVEAFFRALIRTHRTYLQGDYKTDPEVAAALAEVLGQPEEAIATLPDMRFNPNLSIETIASRLADYEEMFRIAGVIEYDGTVTRDMAIDTSPVDAVLAGEQ